MVQSVLTGNVRPMAEMKLGALGLDRHLDLEAGAYGESHEARADLSVRYQQLLRAEVPLPLVTVPYLFDRSFGLQSIEKVASAIEAVL